MLIYYIYIYIYIYTYICVCVRMYRDDKMIQDTGFYRDDGLVFSNISGPQAEKIKKNIRTYSVKII